MNHPSDAPTDQALIERTLAGDGAAFGVLMERFQRKIYRVAFSVVRDEVEADTITQDTFIQAYTHLARFEGLDHSFVLGHAPNPFVALDRH